MGSENNLEIVENNGKVRFLLKSFSLLKSISTISSLLKSFSTGKPS
jgi:hypothetical protein